MTAASPIAVVSVSGGKDSTATALLAIDRYGRDRVRLVHADTGHEHETTELYIRETLPAALGLPIEIVRADFSDDIARKRRYIAEKWLAKLQSGAAPLSDTEAQAVIDRALSILHPTGIPFLDLCMMKGRFPSRMAQFCTQFLKRYPLDDFMLNLIAAGMVVESWQGVRRDESENRREALDREQAAEGWWIERPIAAWTGQQTVNFVLSRGVPLNPLYGEGCNRVGCMLCINAGKNEIANCARRWPHHVARIRDWERLVGMASKRGFSSLLHHADGEGMAAAEAFAACNIDAMVGWSMTSRGGKQFDWLRSVELPSACSSSYGLCE